MSVDYSNQFEMTSNKVKEEMVTRRGTNNDETRHREKREKHSRRSGEKSSSRSRQRSRSYKRKRSNSHDHRSSRRHRSRDKRSRSHDRKRKSASPNPLMELKKNYKYWDVAPTGYEHMSAAEFKQIHSSGQVLPSLYLTEGNVVNMGLASTEYPSIGNTVSRQARRIYVGNLPLGVTEEGMMEFFNEQIKLKEYTQAGDPIIAVQINTDKNFAFLEFRSVEETNQGLNLDGIVYHGFALKLRRPRDYVPLPTAFDGIVSSSMTAGIVQDTPHKLFVGGLPQYLGEDQVKELLQTFGPLRGFNLVKDSTTGLSKGYAFCEYADHSVTDKACLGLTGMQLGEKRIVVQRACLGAKNSSGIATGPLMLSQPMMDPTKMANVEETEVLCLHNMVMIDDLNDDDEYEEIMEDVKEECSKFGTVLSVQIPRPTGMDEVNVNGVGKIYVEFQHKSETVKAMKSLSGRTFSGKVVVTSFYDLEKYRNGFF